MKRVVFMGTPQYAREILQALLEDRGVSIPLVLTQPDRPVGRKRELKQSEVKILAMERGLEIFQPDSLRDESVYKKILSVEPDLIIVSAYGQLLPKNILDIAPCINLHASLLPKYRGASPVQEALLNGDKFTGVTAMLMEEGLDSGAILSYRYFKIPPDMVLPELMEQLSKDASMLTIETVKQFNKIQPLEQTRAISTHCKKIKRSDGLVDFGSAETLYNKYRAFYGWPTIFLESGLKLLDIKLLDKTSENRAGEILELNRESIVVGCRLGKIEIFKVQPKSKRAMSAKAYSVGRGLKVGNSLF